MVAMSQQCCLMAKNRASVSIFPSNIILKAYITFATEKCFFFFYFFRQGGTMLHLVRKRTFFL